MIGMDFTKRMIKVTWQKLRRQRDFVCSKCKATRTYEEFDEEEDICLYCLFPEAQQHRSAEYNKTMGYDRNQTEVGYVMENLTDIPINPRNNPITYADRKILNKVKPKKRKVYI